MCIVLEVVLEVAVEDDGQLLKMDDVEFMRTRPVHTLGSASGHGPTRIIEIDAPGGCDFHTAESFENPVEFRQRKG